MCVSGWMLWCVCLSWSFISKNGKLIWYCYMFGKFGDLIVKIVNCGYVFIFLINVLGIFWLCFKKK